MLDLVGFRRLGHNEGDEPSYTQPVMYARVKAHPGTRHLYAQQLIREGVITEEELKSMTDTVVEKYEGILARAKQIAAEKPAKAKLSRAAGDDEDGSTVFETGVPAEYCRKSPRRSRSFPNDFTSIPKWSASLPAVQRWARARCRWTGRLARRWLSARSCSKDFRCVSAGRIRAAGTFSQRHASMYDTMTGDRWSPLNELRSEANPRARAYVFDSSLSEYGVLGFRIWLFGHYPATSSWRGKPNSAIFRTGHRSSSTSTFHRRRTNGSRGAGSSCCCRTATRARGRSIPRPGLETISAAVC